MKIHSSKLNYSMEITEHISQQESKFTPDNKHVKVQMKCFFIKIAKFERAAKISKITVYHFLISLLVPEL